MICVNREKASDESKSLIEMMYNLLVHVRLYIPECADLVDGVLWGDITEKFKNSSADEIIDELS